MKKQLLNNLCMHIQIHSFYKYITVILFCIFLSSCRYYKTDYKPAETKDITSLQPQTKNIILHYGTQIWQLKNVEINSVQQKILGKIYTLNKLQIEYCKDELGARRYKKRTYDPLNDMHLYTSEIAITADSNVIIPFSAIHHTADNKMHKPANLASKALVGASGILVAIMLYLIDDREF